MTRSSGDRDGAVRTALRSIVGDPQHGAAALSHPAAMSNLLKDLLPDSPRESALLVAAAQHDLAGLMRDHLAQGLDLRTASRLAAKALAERMPFTDEACEWVASELAVALGGEPQATAVWESVPQLTERDDQRDADSVVIG